MSAGFGFGFDPTKMAGGAGFGGISSVTPSFGVGSGSTAWVSEQTGLFSTGDVDVSVGGATDILGAVIGSSEGNVIVETDTLTHANLSDHNVYNDVGVSVTLSAGLWTPPRPTPVPGSNGTAAGQNGEDQGGNPLCASIGGCTSPNWTTQGHYAFDDSAQNTNATIGTSEGGTVSVTIRDTEAQQDLEDSGQTAGADEINSDLDTAQVVTRDEHERVDFYLSDSSLEATAQAVGKTVEAVRKIINDVYISLRNSGLFTEEDLSKNISTDEGRLELVEIGELVSTGGTSRTLGRRLFTRRPTTQQETTLIFLANNLRGLARRADERGLSLPPSISSTAPRSPAQEINYLRFIKRQYEQLLRGDNGGPPLNPVQQPSSGQSSVANQSPNHWILYGYPFYGDDLATDRYFQQNRQFWTEEPVNFDGNRVYQRNDLFDPNQTSTIRRGGININVTNIERMAMGLAPRDRNNNPINLHHMTQTQDGAIVEMSQTFHQNNYGTIHINTGQLPSGISRPQFDRWRQEYWRNRAGTWRN